jgi:DNA-binding NtrC family response regulator
VLENGEFQRLGETQRRVSRARVVAATNRDLRQEMRAGRFRSDLYHRLSVLSLALPPLRELERDKLLLLEHFRRLYAAQAGVQAFSLDESGERRWLQYSFPGNVRELRNIVIRLTTKHPGQRLSAAEVEPELDLVAGGALQEPSAEGAPRDVMEQALRELERGVPFSLDHTLKAWERTYIEAALRLTRGNMSQAAKLLGVNRTTLYSRLSAEEK